MVQAASVFLVQHTLCMCVWVFSSLGPPHCSRMAGLPSAFIYIADRKKEKERRNREEEMIPLSGKQNFPNPYKT